MEILNQLKTDQNGLIPAIIQDDENKEVLMVGYMNREAVRKTLESGVSASGAAPARNTGSRGRLQDTRKPCEQSPLIAMPMRY